MVSKVHISQIQDFNIIFIMGFSSIASLLFGLTQKVTKNSRLIHFLTLRRTKKAKIKKLALLKQFLFLNAF